MSNKLLFRLAVLVAAMMCALGAAAAEAYACYTSTNNTLTFYYDNQRSSRTGETFALNTGNDSPAWDYVDLNENVRKVVFHSSFASARPTSTCRWFADKLLLESIEGLNYLNTSAVTIMANMFSDSYLIGNLDLSHFNTANVTDMSFMFGEFYTEKRLLNLSSFDTRNVTKMDRMFSGSNVKTIIVGDGWTTENVASAYGMFAVCGSLVGGMGTAYHFNQDGIEYAHIDGGESNPGYFTSAQDYNSKPYAVLTIEGQDLGSRQILTFYNDHQRLSHSEITYGIEIIESSNFFMNVGPEWYIPDDNEYSNINGVVFDPSFASARPKNTYNWFAGMIFLDDITGIEYLNTSEVTNMANMFKGCINLTAIDLSHFNTSKVTNMEYMFQDCQQLLQLDVSHFNTSNVTNMEGMFDGCQRLSQLDVTNFNTSNVTNMEYMFHDCQRLLQLDLSHFDTSKVIYMNQMFYRCTGLTSLDLSSFNTSNVRNMSQMFQGCTSLQTIIVSNQWTTASLSVTGSSMFNDCTSLVGGMGTVYDSNHYDEDYAHIDGGPSNPGYLTDAYTYYYACYTPSNTTLTFYYDDQRTSRPGTTYSLNAVGTSPDWYTDNTYKNVTKVVFDASFSAAYPKSTFSWFARMTNLTSITGLSNLSTFYTQDMSYMFYGCTGLTSLDLTGFQTPNLKNMEYMFFNCSNLTRVDLSSFNTAGVTNMNYLFRGCSRLATIYAGSGWTIPAVTAGNFMFSGCTNLVGGRGTTYDASHVDKTYAHIDGGPSNPGYLTAVDYGLSVGGVAVTYKNASNITGPGIVSGTASYNPSTRMLTLNNVNITLNTTAGISVNGTFDGDVCYINLVGDNHLDVTNYYPLFVAKATTITGNGTLDTGSGSIKVSLSAPLVIEGGCTVMGSSIMGSSSDGETVTVRGSETSVIMSYTIWGLAGLTLNDGLFIVEPAGGYYDPSSRWMKNANGTNCTSGVTINNGRQMYAERSAENNGSVTLTFYYDNQRDTRPGTTFSINKGMVDPEWYEDGYSYDITKVVFDPSFAGARPTSTHYWFAEMQDLTSIEGMQYLNTSKVTTMNAMFWECTSLPAVDVSGFDTRNVTDMSWLFSECYELTGLDVSGWNTSNVTTMPGLFGNCSSLTSLDVSHFNTSNVTNMCQLFNGCSGLTSLDVSNFDTSNVTDMSYMFTWCKGLQQLDLSGFNTSKVTNMSCMFNECDNLRTIYVGDSWTTAAVTSSSYMFDVCHSLVGGKGTTYSSSNPKDKTYAHIDGGTSNPGYFTAKNAGLRGDVDNDGKVNISDVTALINLLLTGNTPPSTADCDQDGKVNISDVTALINYLLSGSWN